MKLDEVHVDRYGPFRESLQFTDDVHVVYGPNESGKTLLVESLLLSLTGNRSVAQARLDERPEGYVSLRSNGHSHKLDAEETILDRFESQYNFSITPSEFRDIFVIRDGDLSIAEEAQFYQRVTDQLVGIWTSDIETTRDEVLARGRLTPERRELSAQHDDAREQRRRARELRADVREYLERAEAEGLASMERDRYRAKAEKERAEATVAELEAAKARREYEDLVTTRDTVQRSLDERAELPDDERIDEIRRRLDALETGRESELRDRKTWYGRTALASILAGGAAFGAALALAGREALVTRAGPGAFAVVALLSLVLYRSASKTLAGLESEREGILETAREAGIDAYDVADVRSALAEIEERRADLDQIVAGKAEVLRDRLDVEAREPAEVVEAAGDALAAREPAVEADPDREFVAEELEAAREQATAAAERYREYTAALRDHRRELESFADRAAQLRFATFCDEPFDLEVANLDALDRLETRLGEFVAAIETDADVSRAAATVLEEMAAAENEKMTRLFEADGRAVDVFTRITDDRYVDVGLNEESGLEVELSNGRRLSPLELSRGTRDQLYLAVRVALGRRLLEGRDGFFVMDDAFLAADPRRLRRQAEVVADLADAGWQVIYLTAKRDARQTLVEETDATITELSPL